MFTLDAELGSERDNFKDQEKKELEDSIINCRKSENADMQLIDVFQMRTQ